MVLHTKINLFVLTLSHDFIYTIQFFFISPKALYKITFYFIMVFSSHFSFYDTFQDSVLSAVAAPSCFVLTRALFPISK